MQPDDDKAATSVAFLMAAAVLFGCGCLCRWVALEVLR